MKRIVHLLANLGVTSGVANIARRFERLERECGDEVVMLAPAKERKPPCWDWRFALAARQAARRADEIWVHCSWTFPVWYGAWLARRLNKRLIVVPQGSFDPLRLGNRSGWKKRLVAPLDRWVLRCAAEVRALCAAEAEWIRAFEPSAKVVVAKVPRYSSMGSDPTDEHDGLNVLFLGRALDPLKGVRFLERAVGEVNALPRGGKVELHIVSDHTGEQLERDWHWCDVLCLPTLSENFGLVVAEALERGKRVITTDGAPAWADSSEVVYLRGFRGGSDAERVRLLREALAAMV